ncbi:hypothetical protein [Brachyspira pilosicoli]|uniref:hypothetical protein n=1 Tax=Brachyspira pilosicoli TaxID=52584 RepID=UPI001CA5837A|nr:hypothetical protein [Brachyspira pilosicoli]MBW5397292.1 hypothetical protein [Brachyspira pilosicoli]
MRYFIIILLFIYSCSSINTNSKTLNNGWINENKFSINSIGYPNTDNNATSEENKNSAYNAALSLSIVKIENAFSKELPQNYKYYDDLKSFISNNVKVEYANYVDNRYYNIMVSIEYNNLLDDLRKGKKITK